MPNSGKVEGVGDRKALASKRLRKLVDDGRLTLVGAVGPMRLGRVLVVADEVDTPDHQRVTITTR